MLSHECRRSCAHAFLLTDMQQLRWQMSVLVVNDFLLQNETLCVCTRIFCGIQWHCRCILKTDSDYVNYT